MVITTPKGNGNLRGIGTMEVLWKTVLGVISCFI